ncbi:hypothetical protein [Glycomyces dulcitolivorans]|uniref:hypothetical protein n=1 Tax=Glycomyces dulcitolivorans TaxID=2200759 RepID=UPI000DD47F5C|nr:hypothetical protein [Glycomyces dulcitolivorans]
MTTNIHDTPLKLARFKPGFAVELARDLLGIPIPEHDQILPYSESATDREVRDLNADNVVVCSKDDKTQIGIILEVQRGKDNRKRFSWPAYQVNIRHRITAPVALIVICPQPAVAAWAAEAIELGHPGFTFQPLVLGQHNYPKLTEPSGSGYLAEQMVLGTLIHETSDEIEQLLTAASAELEQRSYEEVKRYTEYMLGQLSEHARTILEALVQQETYPYQSKLVADLKAEGRAEGKAEGESNALLIIIESRGLAITENERRKIETCQDLNRLNSWLKRAATAPSVADILG